MLFGEEVADDYLDLAIMEGIVSSTINANVNQEEHHYSVLQKSYGGDSVVSNSSMDVSVVPESALCETSNSHPRPLKGTIDLFSGPQFRYLPAFSNGQRSQSHKVQREEKKNRKFEKTIRYASRKAYAETRPRIKGRFVRRTDA
ncbi:Zinc finger protein [Datura stramonium]|uniref:Zinc finger protein n=1 Tax=Datura stramonium TaxID=4076 RepID=A0ABS8TIZ6_DATST|nr:Zinc finger protein [Datura stramonium]